MNLFSNYQKRFLHYLKSLEKKKIIVLPNHLKNLTVELPPKGHKADMSCNVAMILAKFNQKTPLDLANILKKNFLENFKEFEKIDVAKPGFLNINFKIDFWKNHLFKIIQSDANYGSNRNLQQKYNIEFVSANPTGPLHVGHCRGAIIGDALSNLLKFNGHLVTKEYYVNDYGNQIKIFVLSVYHRILEITEEKIFPFDKDLYPGDYIIDIAKKIVEEKNIKDFKNFNKVYEKLAKESLKFSIKLIKNNLDNLGVEHDSFVYESELIKNELVSKTCLLYTSDAADE